MFWTLGISYVGFLRMNPPTHCFTITLTWEDVMACDCVYRVVLVLKPQPLHQREIKKYVVLELCESNTFVFHYYN